MQREPVLATINKRGQQIMDSTRALLAKHGLTDCMGIGGKPAWSLLQFHDASDVTSWQIKSLYLQELIARGILCAGSHNMAYAHTDGDLAQLAGAQDEAMAAVRAALKAGDIGKRLAGPPIQPIFKIR